MNKSSIKKFQIALKRLESEQNLPYWDIENLMPDYVKKTILNGEEFRMAYNNDFGYLISYNSRDIERVDEVQTSNKSIFAELKQYENENGTVCDEILFNINDKKWRVILNFVDSENGDRFYPLYIAYEDLKNKYVRTAYFDVDALIFGESDDKNGIILTSSKVEKLNKSEIEIMKEQTLENENNLSL